MNAFITGTARLIQAGKQAYGSKWTFSALFLSLFIGSVGLLGQYDLLPNVAENVSIAAANSSLPEDSSAIQVEQSQAELPMKIQIPTIGLTAQIANPTSTNAETLDAALLKGAVRYPTSAQLGEEGNVVVFGHSSYLPVVTNQAFKTFDGIQKLHAGDTIMVYSSDMVYTYQVDSVSKENVTDDAVIPLSVTGRILTLSTCNSFATKSDRFVVVANFVQSHQLI